MLEDWTTATSAGEMRGLVQEGRTRLVVAGGYLHRLVPRQLHRVQQVLALDAAFRQEPGAEAMTREDVWIQTGSSGMLLDDKRDGPV